MRSQERTSRSAKKRGSDGRNGIEGCFLWWSEDDHHCNDGSEENRRKIEEILSASAPEIMLDRNRLCTYEMGIEIDVSIKPDSAFSSGNGTVDERVYRIMGDTVPECIEKALNYSKISTKYVRKGIGVMKND